MRALTFLAAALLPLGDGSRSFVFAIEREKGPSISSASSKVDTSTDPPSRFGSIDAAEGPEGAPYLLRSLPEAAFLEKRLVNAGPVLASTSTEELKRRSLSALKRSALLLLLAPLLSVLVHETLVYPKIKKIQEEEVAENGRPLPEEEAYDVVLETDATASTATLVVAILSALLFVNFAYRLARWEHPKPFGRP